MRPIFETDEDRRREDAVAVELERAWQCSALPSLPLAHYDFLALRDGRLVGVVEIRVRNRVAYDYGACVFLNCQKRADLIDAARQLHAPPIFVWSFQDQMRWIDVRDLDGAPVEVRGRTDRDGKDVQPAYRLPISMTHKVRTR